MAVGLLRCKYEAAAAKKKSPAACAAGLSLPSGTWGRFSDALLESLA
jgi:hypothetical protein